MIRPVRLFSLVALALAGPGALAAQQSRTDAEYLALGRRYTEWFLSGQADSLLAAMTPAARERVGGLDGLSQRHAAFSAGAGKQLELLEEQVDRPGNQPRYTRVAQFERPAHEPLVVRWRLDPEGRIVGGGIGPRSEAEP